MQGINAWVTCVGYPSSNSSASFTSVGRQRNRLGPRWSDWNTTREGELTPHGHPKRPSAVWAGGLRENGRPRTGEFAGTSVPTVRVRSVPAEPDRARIETDAYRFGVGIAPRQTCDVRPIPSRHRWSTPAGTFSSLLTGENRKLWEPERVRLHGRRQSSPFSKSMPRFAAPISWTGT